MIRKQMFLAAAAVAALSFTACVDSQADDDSLGESEAAITVGRHFDHRSDQADEYVALTSAQTCFLSGVTGQLYGQPYLAEPPNFGPPLQANPAEARVYISNGAWWVHAQKGLGGGVTAHVQCIPVAFTAANGADTLIWSDNHTVDSTPDATSRHCFLSRVWGTSGFRASGNNLTLTRGGGEWTLGGFVQNVGGDQQFGGGEAVCINTPAAVENAPIMAPTVFGGFGLAIVATNTSVDTGLCGLTQVKGDWDDWGPFGWNAGVYVTPNSSSTYSVYATDSRGGNERCLH